MSGRLPPPPAAVVARAKVSGWDGFLPAVAASSPDASLAEEWHYQSALRTDKGTFHVSCFADAAHSGSLESPSAKVPPVRVTDADAGEGSTVVEPPSALPDDIGGAAAPSPKKMKI